MKQDNKPRTLKRSELKRISDWLKAAWEKAGAGRPACNDFEDLFMAGPPSNQGYGRYAQAETSSPTIAAAATFICRMGGSLIHGDSPEPIPPEAHKAIFEEMRKRTESNDFEFFECVAIMLRHRREKKKPIAKLEWRSIKKFATGQSRQPEMMTLKKDMEPVVFQVLLKRARRQFFESKREKNCTTAVTRKELREALRKFQKSQGRSPDIISEPNLSTLLTSTESGRFLHPFMQEQQRIPKRKQKV